MSPRPRQRPKVPQRPSRGPHLAQGQEKMSGKSLEVPFATAWGSTSARQQRTPPSLLPLCLCNSLPPGSSPTRCCSMKSSLANHSAPDRARHALIGCMDRLCLSPLGLPRRSGRCEARTRRETAISGKDPPKTRAGITVPF